MRFSIQMKLQDVIETFRQKGMADGMTALEDLSLTLLGVGEDNNDPST
jgi:hypothetical protein